MTGGMNRPGTPLPAWLRDHHRQATQPLPPQPSPDALGPGRQHCYVQDPDDAPGWWPAVLVQWRRLDDGWHAQVACVVADEPPVLVVAWVRGEQLRPA
jgi:hypothetical protein